MGGSMAGTLFDKTAIPYDGSNGAELAVMAVGPILKAAGGDLHFVMVLDQYVKNELEQFGQVEHLTIDQAAAMGCERLVAFAKDAGFNSTFVILTDTEVVEGTRQRRQRRRMYSHCASHPLVQGCHPLVDGEYA